MHLQYVNQNENLYRAQQNTNLTPSPSLLDRYELEAGSQMWMQKKITFQNFRILKFCLTLDVILGGRVTYK